MDRFVDQNITFTFHFRCGSDGFRGGRNAPMDAMGFPRWLFYYVRTGKWHTIARQAPYGKTIPGWGYFKVQKNDSQNFLLNPVFPGRTMAENHYFKGQRRSQRKRNCHKNRPDIGTE